MPPITAATIATIAMGAGRSRTDRTVAVSVPGARAEDPFEPRTASCAKLRPASAFSRRKTRLERLPIGSDVPRLRRGRDLRATVSALRSPRGGGWGALVHADPERRGD